MLFDNDLRVSTNQSLTDFTPTAGTYMGAAFTEGWRYTPISSIARMSELRTASEGSERIQAGPALGYGAYAQPDKEVYGVTIKGQRRVHPDQVVKIPPKTKKLTQQDAMTVVKDNQLNLDIPADGITEEALGLLIDRKKEEIQFKFQQEAAPDGVLPTAAKFSAQVAANLLDPLNIAVSFVPVVGQTRYLQMLERASGALGRAGVRAGVGAVEGAVGNLLIEPLVYTAAQQEQADYSMMDSVFNVLVGGVMGSGLHAGAGAISDAIKIRRSARTAEPTGGTAQAISKASQQTKESMLRAAVAQEATGYRANVNPVAAFDAELNPITRAVRREVGDETIDAPSVSGVSDVTPTTVDVQQPVNIDIPQSSNPNDSLSSGFKETYDINNSRTADLNSSRTADETILRGDVELDQSITNITDELNDLAARNNVDLAGKIEEYQAPVREAELDAKALEAAVLCRIQL